MIIIKVFSYLRLLMNKNTTTTTAAKIKFVK